MSLESIGGALCGFGVVLLFHSISEILRIRRREAFVERFVNVMRRCDIRQGLYPLSIPGLIYWGEADRNGEWVEIVNELGNPPAQGLTGA